MKPFSIIIPAYNEEEILARNVAVLVKYLKNFKLPYEIVIVSNGSTDATNEIGKKLEQQYPQLQFHVLLERGVGRAFKKGLAESKYDQLIFLDADLSADLGFVLKANKLLEESVLVLGSKIKGLQHRGTFRKLGSFVFYLSVLFLIGLRYVDYAPGAKAYQKSFLNEFLAYIDDYTSFVLTLTFLAARKKLPIREIPITCQDYRQSRFNLWHEALSKYQGLFRLKMKQLLRQL